MTYKPQTGDILRVESEDETGIDDHFIETTDTHSAKSLDNTYSYILDPDWVDNGYLTLVKRGKTPSKFVPGDRVKVADAWIYSSNDNVGVDTRHNYFLGKEVVVLSYNTASFGEVVVLVEHKGRTMNIMVDDLISLDETSKEEGDITTLYEKQGHNFYKAGDTTVRWANRRKDGERQLVIKYGDSSQTTCCVKESDVPKLAAALMEYF